MNGLRRTLLLLVAVMFLAAIPAVARAASDVALAWDANTESDLAGYKIYWGTVSGTYTNSVDVGNVTTYTVKGLPDGKVFFAATAYDGAKLESGYSNEVSVTLDSTPPAYPKNLKAVSVKATINTKSGSITATITTGQ